MYVHIYLPTYTFLLQNKLFLKINICNQCIKRMTKNSKLYSTIKNILYVNQASVLLNSRIIFDLEKMLEYVKIR